MVGLRALQKKQPVITHVRGQGLLIGVELTITRLEGKWKVSQNRPAPDRAGIARGLRAEGDEPSLTMADLVDGADQITSREPSRR